MEKLSENIGGKVGLYFWMSIHLTTSEMIIGDSLNLCIREWMLYKELENVFDIFIIWGMNLSKRYIDLF